MKFSKEHINRSAEKILKDFLDWIEKENIIESIYDTYVKACDESLNKFGVEARELSNEIISRLRFEILCFGSSLSILLAPQFFNVSRGMFGQKLHDKEGKLLFRDCIWSLTNDIVNELRLNVFREFILKRVEPQIQFGLGNPLSFDNRCNEYAEAFFKDDGSEIELFGKKIGISLDPNHFAFLSIIGGTFSKIIAGFIGIELKHYFKG